MIGLPEWIKENYQIEPPKIEYRKDDICKEIFCCAYREYDELSGTTGGPGGVLHMQQEIIGERIRNVDVSYIFKPVGRCTPENVWNAMNELNGAIKIVIAAAGYIYSNEKIRKGIGRGRNPKLFCHDVGSAYGAYLLGIPYIIVYHQQGSILQEIKSVGKTYTQEEKEIIRFIEEVVMFRADKIFFPSKGAKKVFEDTTILERDVCSKLPFADKPLYNTIDNFEDEVNVEDIYRKLKINIQANEEMFLSIGDYIFDKGMDLIPQFLNAYKKMTGQQFVWIAIGNSRNGKVYDEISSTCEKLHIKAYLIPNRISHKEIISLLEKADYYLMLHRKSIFDLATLEAMRAGCKLVLSDCLSNREFCVNNNVVLVVDQKLKLCIDEMTQKSSHEWEENNRIAFENFFSKEHFKHSYLSVIDEFIK